MRLMLRLARTQRQQPGLGHVQVLINVEADVKLLGHDLAGPTRSPVVVDSLKTDEESMLTIEAREIGLFWLMCGSCWSGLASWQCRAFAAEGEHHQGDDRVGGAEAEAAADDLSLVLVLVDSINPFDSLSTRALTMASRWRRTLRPSSTNASMRLRCAHDSHRSSASTAAPASCSRAMAKTVRRPS